MIASAYSNVMGAAFGGVMFFIWLIVLVLVIAGMWKTFVKAGHPGWGAIIPIYNLWIIVKMAGREPMWFWLIFILALIPIVNIAAIVLLLIVDIDVARNFGHGAGFAVLLWLFPEIMYLILGFGASEYRPTPAGGSQARLA